MRRFKLVTASAAVLVLIAAASPAFAKKSLPAQCPDARFLVQGTPLIRGASTSSLEAITLGSSVEITTGCAPASAKVTRTRKGTVLKASWLSCPGLAGRVKLKALVAAPDCATMTGTLTASKATPKKHAFTAARSDCGDLVVDPDPDGQECDGAGTCPIDQRCTDACRCEAAGTTLPAVIVATDDVIVVHLNPSPGAGFAPSSDLDFPALTLPANYDGGWDLTGSPSGIAFGTRVIQVGAAPDTGDPAGRIVDKGFLAALRSIQGVGL